MTTSANRFSVSSPADILGYVPHALGFMPRESVVLMTIGSNVLGATLRLDIPAGIFLEFAMQAQRFLEQDRTADSVIAVIYSDHESSEPGAGPHEELMHCLELVLESEGTPIQAAWLVARGFWRDFYCDATCCPWPGQPLADVVDSELNAELIYRGSSYDESLEAAVIGTVGEPWEKHQSIRSGQDQWRRSLEGAWTADPQFGALLRVWDTALDHSADPEWITHHADVASYLIASLESRDVRDAVLVLAASGFRNAMTGARACGLIDSRRHGCVPVVPQYLADLSDVPEVMVSEDHAPGTDVAAEMFAGIIVGTAATVPFWPRLDRAHDLFRALTAVASGEPQLALLTMLGWIEWSRGRGSRAGKFFDMCLSLDSSYRLARLLNELLNRGQLPSWATERGSAWSGHRARAARAA